MNWRVGIFLAVLAVGAFASAASCGGLLDSATKVDSDSGVVVPDAGVRSGGWCDYDYGPVSGPDAFPRDYIFECVPFDHGLDVFSPTTCGRMHGNGNNGSPDKFECCFSGELGCCPIEGPLNCDAFP